MPFSSNKDFKKNPRIIVKAEGIYLKTHEGNTLIDGRLYCNLWVMDEKKLLKQLKIN